jgi:hypothetical protein
MWTTIAGRSASLGMAVCRQFFEHIAGLQALLVLEPEQPPGGRQVIAGAWAPRVVRRWPPPRESRLHARSTIPAGPLPLPARRRGPAGRRAWSSFAVTHARMARPDFQPTRRSGEVAAIW